MADEAEKKPTALEKMGVGEADLDDKHNQTGNPEPAPEPNKAPEAKKEDPAPAEETPAEGADDAAGETGEAEGEDKPLDTDVWGTTGDEVGDSVLELLQNSGLEMDEAKSIMFDAIQAGDVTKVDEATLIEKVGKAKANLIMAGARDFVTRSKAKAETILNEVHKTVDGEENWNTVTTWAKENVSESELAEYRAMIDNGGAQARFAASELMGRYNGDENNTTLGTAATAEVIGDAAAAPSARATSRNEYVVELTAAHDRGASDAEIQAIKSARARGRAKGI